MAPSPNDLLQGTLGLLALRALALLFRQGGRLVLGGLVTGALLLWPVTHLLEQHLFETSALDLSILAIAACTIMLAATTAISLPARRALRINPIEALRGE